MNKASYIIDLFNDLKDKIEYDEDVAALFKILKNLLKIDKNLGIQKWIYIIEKYPLKEIKKEIDFTPLTQKFLIELLKYQNLEEILNLLTKLPLENKGIIENEFFNVFNKQSGIYNFFEKVIKNKETSKEIENIKLIKNNAKNYDPLIFDFTTFLKNIILIHIQTNNINIKVLLKISDFSNNKKDKALLKTLFIDYI